MQSPFHTYLRIHTSLNDEEITRIESMAQSRTVRRGDHLLREGEICRHKTFVNKGLLRTYSIAADGSEPIIQFAPELHWTLDVESYDRQQPARFNIAAVETTEALLWAKPDFDRMLSEVPALKQYSQQLISHNIHLGRQRLATALSATPEEKYEEFARSSPDLLARLPLKMIAAYLGISIKTLTRVRHAQWAR